MPLHRMLFPDQFLLLLLLLLQCFHSLIPRDRETGEIFVCHSDSFCMLVSILFGVLCFCLLAFFLSLSLSFLPSLLPSFLLPPPSPSLPPSFLPSFLLSFFFLFCKSDIEESTICLHSNIPFFSSSGWQSGGRETPHEFNPASEELLGKQYQDLTDHTTFQSCQICVHSPIIVICPRYVAVVVVGGGGGSGGGWLLNDQAPY